MKKLLACLLVAMCSVANAIGNGYQDIVKIELHDSGHVKLYLADYQHNETCMTTGWEKVIILDKNYAHFERMYSMALTALASNRQIFVHINGCVDVWGNGSKYGPKAITMVVKQ